MKKYLFIFKATLIESFHYVMNILLGFISFFVALFVFYNLWRYLYSDTNNLINGYSMNQMIWFVILTEIIWFGTRNQTLTNQVNNDIRSGTIAYLINKPYHYIFYIVSRNLGEIFIKFFLFLIAGIIIGISFVGYLPGLTITHIPLIAMIFLLGILIHSFLRISISLLSFWIEDSTPYQWIYDKLILVIGTIFPVEMFPVWLQPLIRYTPIYVITYGPAKLVIDYSQEMFLKILQAQMIYFIISFIIMLSLYQRGVKKLNVNGG